LLLAASAQTPFVQSFPSSGPSIDSSCSSIDGKILSNLPGFVYQRSNDDRWTMEYVSAGFTELTGLVAASSLGGESLNFMDLIHPGDRERVIRTMTECSARGMDYSLEYRVNLEQGGQRWFADRGCGLTNEQGELLGCTGFITDITEQKLADQHQQRAEERFRLLFEASPDAIGVIDRDGRLLEINPVALQMFGCSDRERFLACQPADLSPAHQPDGRCSREAAAAMIAVALQQGAHEFRWQHRRLDNGEPFDALVTMRRIVLEGTQALLTRVRDISELNRQDRRLRQLAYADALTGLVNRQAALEWLEQHLNQQAPAPLLLVTLDIDNFQWLNQTFGRERGDRLLRSQGQALAERIGPTGLVARLQSDEFLLITPLPAAGSQLDLTEETQRRQWLQELEGQLRRAHDMPTMLSYCSGTTLLQPGEHLGPAGADQLLQQVNTALSEARRSGNNRQRFYEPAMTRTIEERLQLESRLIEAVHNSSFRILYQPIVNLQGQLTGAEALMRWPQADGQMIPPSTFIPLAEKTGRIGALGSWLIDSTCAQLAAWQRRGLTLDHLSINISPAQLGDSENPLHELLMAAVQRHGLAPDVLQLELTETTVLANIDLARAELERLAQAGFRLALDDFGTGYSSLVTLQQLPFTSLKIDRSFVQSITSDDKSRALVESCVSIAQKLGLGCVAEGVETEAQCLLLRRLGCHSYQGFLFDQALPAATLEQRLRRQRASGGAGGAGP
jgi:diguanylate cyclase (GGDEF)-like protein/PAS domain S-box-containing protein